MKIEFFDRNVGENNQKDFGENNNQSSSNVKNFIKMEFRLQYFLHKIYIMFLSYYEVCKQQAYL